MRASGVAWAWVAQQVREGRVAQGERVFCPEMGRLAHTDEQVLWQLVAQATTGWNIAVREKISMRMLSRVVLSRQVLKSTLRVRERELADSLGLTTGEVWDMDLGPVEMTPRLAAEVWRNTNTLAGLVEGDGAGRRRFWACMHMFKKEGLVRGNVGTHPRDESWEGMAEEMLRLQAMGPKWSPGDGWRDRPPCPVDIWGAIEAAPGTGAGAGAGQMLMLEGPEEEVGGGDTVEQSGAEEGGDTSEEEVELSMEGKGMGTRGLQGGL